MVILGLPMYSTQYSQYNIFAYCYFFYILRSNILFSLFTFTFVLIKCCCIEADFFWGGLFLQYRDDKTRIKDAVKLRKVFFIRTSIFTCSELVVYNLIFWDHQVAISLSWTLDDFKAAISKDIGNPPVPDTNLKVFSRPKASLFLMELSNLPKIKPL